MYPRSGLIKTPESFKQFLYPLFRKVQKNGTVLACSRCLDSGVQRERERARKKIRRKIGGDWGERGLALTPTPPLVVFFLLTSLCVVPWNRLVPCVRGFI